ncbi:MAG: hypothetical protein QW412_00815 [Candidatus Aenigmatarchaeota archaeon]
MGKKIALNTTVDKELLEKFKTLSVAYRKKVKGALQQEIEEAIKQRIKFLEKKVK